MFVVAVFECVGLGAPLAGAPGSPLALLAARRREREKSHRHDMEATMTLTSLKWLRNTCVAPFEAQQVDRRRQ
jgi:hypothetical protein